MSRSISSRWFLLPWHINTEICTMSATTLIWASSKADMSPSDFIWLSTTFSTSSAGSAVRHARDHKGGDTKKDEIIVKQIFPYGVIFPTNGPPSSPPPKATQYIHHARPPHSIRHHSALLGEAFSACNASWDIYAYQITGCQSLRYKDVQNQSTPKMEIYYDSNKSPRRNILCIELSVETALHCPLFMFDSSLKFLAPANIDLPFWEVHMPAGAPILPPRLPPIHKLRSKQSSSLTTKESRLDNPNSRPK